MSRCFFLGEEKKKWSEFLVEFEKSARGRFKSFMHLWMKEFCRELDWDEKAAGASEQFFSSVLYNNTEEKKSS